MGVDRPGRPSSGQNVAFGLSDPGGIQEYDPYKSSIGHETGYVLMIHYQLSVICWFVMGLVHGEESLRDELLEPFPLVRANSCSVFDRSLWCGGRFAEIYPRCRIFLICILTLPSFSKSALNFSASKKCSIEGWILPKTLVPQTEKGSSFFVAWARLSDGDIWRELYNIRVVKVH